VQNYTPHKPPGFFKEAEPGPYPGRMVVNRAGFLYYQRGIEPFWLRNVPADQIPSDYSLIAPNDLASTADFSVSREI
jgi:hypothetical protein